MGKREAGDRKGKDAIMERERGERKRKGEMIEGKMVVESFVGEEVKS